MSKFEESVHQEIVNETPDFEVAKNQDDEFID